MPNANLQATFPKTLDQTELDAILIVDDDPDIIEMLSLMCQDFCHKIQIFSNPLAAKEEILKTNEPSLILSDFNMLPLNGASLAMDTFSHRRLHHQPMVIQTGNENPEILQRLRGLVDEGIIHSVLAKSDLNTTEYIQANFVFNKALI